MENSQTTSESLSSVQSGNSGVLRLPTLESSHRAAAEARFLAAACQAFASNLDPPTIFKHVHAHLQEIMPAQQFFVVQVHEARAWPHRGDASRDVLPERDMPPERPSLLYPEEGSESVAPALREPVLHLAILCSREPEPLLLNSRAQLADQVPSVYGQPLLDEMQAVLAAPIRYQGQFQGALIVASLDPHRQFEPQDGRLLELLAQQTALLFDRLRAWEQVRKRSDQLAAFRAVSSTINEWVQVEQLVQRFLGVLINLAGATHGLFHLVGTNNILRLAAEFGLPAELVEKVRQADLALQTDLRRVLEEGRIRHYDDFEQVDSRERSQALTRLVPLRSILQVPLRVKGRAIGLVTLGRAEGHLQAVDDELLAGLAEQAAQAIENARLFEELQRHAQEQSALRDLAQQYLVAGGPDQVLEQALETIVALVPADYYEILLPTNEGNEFRLAHGRGWLSGMVGRVHVPNAPNLYVGYALRTQALLYVDDFATEARVQPAEHLVRHRVASGLCAPMVAEMRALGLLGVYARTTNAFTSEQSHILSLVAAQTAIALEKARHSQAHERLLAQTQARLAEITALFEFSNLVRAATTEEQLLQLVVENAVRILKGAGGSLQLISPDGEWMQVVAVYRLAHLGWRFSRAQGGLGWEAVTAGESLVVEDVQNDSRVRMPSVLPNLHGGIVVPLRTLTDIFGTLFVGFHERGDPGSDKLWLATTVANLAAQALQRLRLHEQTVRQAASLAAALSDLEQSYQAALFVLSQALDARDRETQGHSQRVTKLALAIGRHLQLSEEELTDMERGALLHDVGKIGISDTILLKPGPLTPHERQIMNEHPRIGYEMLREVPFLRGALPVVLYHQEWYDGTGYPFGLRGEEIPLSARIFAVADAFDAMTSARPYRPAMSREQALQELQRHAGTQFDPHVVEAFLELYAQGSLPIE